jgi:hypothetical protein
MCACVCVCVCAFVLLRVLTCARAKAATQTELSGVETLMHNGNDSGNTATETAGPVMLVHN